MKKVIWLGDTRKVARGLPLTTKHALGTQLMLVQQGLDPADWKPMKSIGPGVKEIRIRAGGAYRVIYTANIGNAVYVLHVFQRKTQKNGEAGYRIGKATARGTAEGNSMIDMNYSSGNIFEDMDVPNADNMKVRAELIIEIKRIMEKEGWNQTEAARHFGVTRTRLNDALRGRLEKMTIDRLVMMLAAVGHHVHVLVNKEPKKAA